MTASPAQPPPAPPLAPIALLSACALSYEVLLVRLFAIIQWHHFAYMIISLALLGYGMSGSLLALFRHLRGWRFERAFAAGCSLFAGSALVAFYLAQGIPFTPQQLPWDPWQWPRLAAIYLLLAVPFVFAAGAICLALARFPDVAHRIYSADVLGAGIGSLGVVVTLYWVSPLVALKLIAAGGLLAAAWVWRTAQLRPGWLVGALVFAAVAQTVLVPGDISRLRPSEYKELSQALQVQGARIIEQRSSPLGWITVVESPLVPFRHAPGLSLLSPGEPPPQLGAFTDGGGMTPLVRYDPAQAPPAYLDYLTTALPYHLLRKPRVLVLGAGGGADVLQAFALGAARVDAVELNPDMVSLVKERFADFTGGIYSKARVHVEEARDFVRRAPDRYDLIQIALLDSFGASAAGVQSLSESYLYTVESLGEMLSRVDSGGLVAITRWVNLPPRDALKLLATASEALRAAGTDRPGEGLVMIRSWNTVTLLMRNGRFSADDIAAVRQFCESRGFDLGWYPGMAAEEAGRFNILDQPYFFEGAKALVGPEAADFIARYKFDIRPATDDRPYFFNFFRWQTLPELMALREQGGLPLLDWGYPVLVVTLVQAVLFSAALILLPVWLGQRSEASPGVRGRRVRTALYFLAVGFAFMFVEIAYIQKFVMFLGQPIHAVAVVLGSFLVFAGAGSRLSLRWRGLVGGRRAMGVAVAALVLVAVIYLLFLPALLQALAGLPRPGKMAASVLLIAPLAFWMGMPFPLVIGRLRDPQLLAWAWGVNGFASVVAAVLATLLAIHLGFTWVVLVALALYALAAATALGLPGGEEEVSGADAPALDPFRADR